mgnify:CR=1 FL=1
MTIRQGDTLSEIAARNGFFKEIWVDPMNHVVEMVGILALFVALIAGFWLYNAKDSHASDSDILETV